MDDFANRVSNYFLKVGYVKGDCIGLFMNSTPEYVAITLGLIKVNEDNYFLFKKFNSRFKNCDFHAKFHSSLEINANFFLL